MRFERRMVPISTSYFAFYAAVAAFMPFHILYMIQSGITSSEQGVITGITPLIAAMSAPLVSGLADKYGAHKMFTILCMVLSMVGFSFFLAVPTDRVGSPMPCVANVNATAEPATNQSLINSTNWNSIAINQSSLAFPASNQSWMINASSPGANNSCHTPKRRSLSFEVSGSIQFWSFLVLRILGYIFFLPATALPNAMAIKILNGDPEKFSVCRAIGSAGFLVWVVLQSVINQFVEPPAFLAHAGQVNFLVVVIMYDIFMVISAISIYFFDLPSSKPNHKSEPLKQAEASKLGNGNHQTADEKVRLADISADNEKQEVDTVANGNGQPIGMIAGLCYVLRNPELCAMLIVVTISGLLWTVHEFYIFWYVEDMPTKPPPIFWGVVFAPGTIMEVPAVFFSGTLIKRIGEVPCMLLVMAAYVIRFGCNALISSPWPILATQALHGITFGVNLVAFTTFLGRLTPPAYGAAVQGLANGAYFGIGAAMGGFLGGVLWEPLGGSNLYFLFAGVAAVVLVVYSLLHYVVFPSCRHSGQLPYDAADDKDADAEALRLADEANPSRTPSTRHDSSKIAV